MVVFFQCLRAANFGTNETNGTKKDVILKNKAGKLLITNNRSPKTKRNKPKNKAEKLLKTLEGSKNKAKNKARHVVENKW
jgi:hypothetical protein